MAHMPKGQPRSVPDPAGEQYDAMIRTERMKSGFGGVAASKASPTAYPGLHSALFERHFDFERPSPDRTITIGRQTYREIDNGRANVLIPISNPSPTELAQQRRAAERVAFMAEHPLAGAAYGIATLMNASPRARNQALAAGGLVDTAMLGGAPRANPVRRPAPQPQGQVAPPSWARPNIRLRELNEKGQARAVNATLTAPMMGTGTKANRRLTPPGWQGHGTKYNEARAHLQGRDLGGSGSDLRNMTTLTHRGVNTPQMSNFERKVAQRVRGGEVVEYSATPIYGSDMLPPGYVLLTAYGSRGAPAATLIRNPAGHRK